MGKTKNRGSETLPLFPDEQQSTAPPYSARNLERLRQLASRGIYLGSSSWKYPGWTGLVYNRPYSTRKVFDQECLAEYSTIFPTVCADFALYDFPRSESMQRMADQTPESFRVALKVTDRITIRRYPNLQRFGAMAGTENPDFLNADLFCDAFLRPLETLGPRRGAIIFEFSTFYPSSGITPDVFVRMLDLFLKQLPREVSFAVEVRNEDFLSSEYLAMLASHGVSHVLNNWTHMPPVVQQLKISGTLTTNFSVIRALLKPGRTYEQAVQTFQPYDRIREENPELRQGVVETIRRCMAEGRSLYAYINNRAEGNSPKTIEGILDQLDRYPEEKL